MKLTDTETRIVVGLAIYAQSQFDDEHFRSYWTLGREGLGVLKGLTPSDIQQRNVEDLVGRLERDLMEPPFSPETGPERGIADISGFLEKCTVHAGQTSTDKYAADRKYEPADVIVDWFGDAWLLGTAVKYLSRLERTGKESDYFKGVHYLGMLYNRRFGRLGKDAP